MRTYKFNVTSQYSASLALECLADFEQNYADRKGSRNGVVYHEEGFSWYIYRTKTMTIVREQGAKT